MVCSHESRKASIVFLPIGMGGLGKITLRLEKYFSMAAATVVDNRRTLEEDKVQSHL